MIQCRPCRDENHEKCQAADGQYCQCDCNLPSGDPFHTVKIPEQ